MGGVDLCGMRRVRAGLPTGRSGAGARRVSRTRRSHRGFALSILRRRLPAHLSRQGNRIVRVEAAMGRPTTTALRQGALRLDYAHHPQRLTKPLIRKPATRSRRLHDGIPADPLSCFARRPGTRRSSLPAEFEAHPRRARRGRRSRLRVRQGVQRRSVPFQKLVRPASDRTMSITARGSAMRLPSPRCSRASLGRSVEPGDGRDGRRGGAG